jgi:cobalamin synthase
MLGMGIGAMKDAREMWFFLVVGAVIGLALGILVSVTTDVPLAPEAGLILGALAGWLLRRGQH